MAGAEHPEPKCDADGLLYGAPCAWCASQKEDDLTATEGRLVDVHGEFFAAIECPMCKEKPGHRCRTSGGRPVVQSWASCHSARWDKAPGPARDRYNKECGEATAAERAERGPAPARGRTPDRWDLNKPEGRASMMLWALKKLGGDPVLAREALERAIKAQSIMKGEAT